MNLKIKFKELASRLTGVSIPVFGISWNPPESESKIIRDVLVYLEDRRALYNPFAHELEHEVAQSVLDIRKELTSAIRRLSADSNAAPLLRAMRSACREYLDETRGHMPLMFSFLTSLGKLRSLFGVNIAYLAIEYGIDIEGELASIVPPQFKEPEDAEEDVSNKRRKPRRSR
jgi:hypothetical protein